MTEIPVYLTGNEDDIASLVIGTIRRNRGKQVSCHHQMQEGCDILVIAAKDKALAQAVVQEVIRGSKSYIGLSVKKEMLIKRNANKKMTSKQRNIFKRKKNRQKRTSTYISPDINNIDDNSGNGETPQWTPDINHIKKFWLEGIRREDFERSLKITN